MPEMTSDVIKKWKEERRLNLIMMKNQKLRLERNRALFERGERITNEDIVGPTSLGRRRCQQPEQKVEGFLKRPEVIETIRNDANDTRKVTVMNETSTGLNFLLSNYSDSDNNDEGSDTEEGEIKSESEQTEKPEPEPIAAPVVQNRPKLKAKKRLAGRKGGGRNQQRQLKYSETLLKRLLSSEIRHERNSILQCINYIVKNQFFDKV